MLVNLYNISLIGHLGTEGDVAGAGMAGMLMNIMANSLMQGISSALSTFVSQAYGTKEYKMCGVYCN